MITLLQLTDKNSIYIPTICDWLYNWWGKKEGFSQEKMSVYVQNSLCNERIPQTFILLNDSSPIGMYQFSITDIDIRPDIYPWLINVYITEEYRGKGLMYFLMQSVEKNALCLNIKELYLFTKHTSLYEKFGWTLVENFKTFLEKDDVQHLYKLTIK